MEYSPKFKADAHLIKVWRTTIASERWDTRIDKNAYDAGASYCRIRIENISSMLPLGQDEYLFPDLPGPVIIIEDDVWMTRDVIENGWLDLLQLLRLR